MLRRLLVMVVAMTACSDKKPGGRRDEPTPKKQPDAAVVADPACLEKLKELGPWLEQLEIELASHEIDFISTLQPIERPALPIPQRIDAVDITPKKIAMFDTAESNHVGGMEKPTQEQLDQKLAEMFAAKPDPTNKRLAPGDLVRIDVDQNAAWGDVVRVVDAATKAGYTRAVFGFTATSDLQGPLGVPLKTTSADDIDKANRRLEAMREECKPWGSAAMRHAWSDDHAANARAVAKETTAALAACNCVVDPDEVCMMKWKDAHWHQATIRVPVTIELAGASPTEIAAPATMPWSEAHAKLIAVVPNADAHPAVHLVAK